MLWKQQHVILMSFEISVRETALNLSHQINLHLYILTVYIWKVIRILCVWGRLRERYFLIWFSKKVSFYLEIISGITESYHFSHLS